tara:strand:+ start:271 stop:414 length:144 start_codon:yes stop_codon:yes gene_type:complete
MAAKKTKKTTKSKVRKKLTSDLKSKGYRLPHGYEIVVRKKVKKKKGK